MCFAALAMADSVRFFVTMSVRTPIDVVILSATE